MEQFSLAYVRAVAAVAACTAVRPEVDDDSVDLTLGRRSVMALVRSPRLDIQVKATAVDCVSDNHVTFALSIKNYDDLRVANVVVPRILVVVVLPPDIADWTDSDEERLAVRRCGYWLSLRGMPATTNTSSETVYLPRSQRLSPAQLHGIFSRLEQNGLP